MTTIAHRAICCLAAAWLAFIAPARLRADEAHDQFAVGAAHYTRHRWQLAVEEFQEFLRQHPLHATAPTARFFLAESLLQLHRYADARNEYQRFLHDHPQDAHAQQAAFRVGETSYLAGDRDDARSTLRAFIEKYPQDPLNSFALAYLGEVELAGGDAERARASFHRVLEQYPQSPLAVDSQFGLARALEKLGAADEAIPIFNELAAGKSKFADPALFHLAACHYAQKKYDAALATLDQFDARAPDSSLTNRARLLRAWSLFQIGRFDLAQSQLKKLTADRQVGAEAQYWLGLTHKKLDQPEAAIATLQAAIALFPKHSLSAAMRFHLGDALLSTEKAAEADVQFAQVLSMSAGSDWADDCLLGRARAALARGDVAAVESFDREYRTKCPQGHLQPEFQRTLGRAYLAAGQNERAIETLTPLANTEDPAGQRDKQVLAEALQRAGKYADALVVLDTFDSTSGDRQGELTRGLALVGLTRYEEALTCFDRVVSAGEGRPAAALALAERAICQFRLDRIDAARSDYEKLCAEHADDPIVLPAATRLAELALTAGKLDFAQALYSTLAAATAEDDVVASGLYGLARIAYRNKEWTSAADKLADLLARFPESPLAAEAIILRGTALERLGDCDAAEHLYREAYEKEPDTPLAERAMLAAARLHRKCQQMQEATRLYRALLEKPHPIVAGDVVLYELAWLLRDEQNITEADQLFERIHRQFPDGPYWADATYRLAESARAGRDYAEAQRLTTALLDSEAAAGLHEYALFLAGQVAVEQQQWDEVVRSTEMLIERFPESKLRNQSEFWLAEAHYRLNELDEAEKGLNRLSENAAAQPEPWFAVVHLRQAQILAQRKQWQAAYEKAAKIGDQYANFKQQYEVDYLLGRCLANQGNFEQARDAYHRVTRAAEASKTETAAMAQWMIGESYFHQKNYSAAVKEYLRVEILYAFPTWQAAALLQAGKCHEQLMQYEEAAELYRRLIEDYPESQFADEASRLLQLSQRNSNSKRS